MHEKLGLVARKIAYVEAKIPTKTYIRVDGN